MIAKADLGASMAARLLNRAKATGDDYQTSLATFCLERFLLPLLEDLRSRAPRGGTWRPGGPWR
jgi:hypothetical protein